MTDAASKFDWLNALADASLVIDRNGVILATNALLVEILETDAVNLSAISVIRPPAFASTLREVRETSLPANVNLEFHGRPQRHINAWLSPLPNDGTILVVLRDLTREQAIENMRSDFVANASHEMRTPLASIIGTIETLQGAAKHDAAAREMFLGTMLTQSLRMKRLIDDLLTLSRIELSEHVRPDAKVDLVNIAKQAKANLSATATEFSVNLQLLASDRVEVSGEADELLQVALNLIENAIKYGGEGGRVEISCGIKGDNGIISVTDFGQGIAEEDIPRLTERFYRVSTKQSRARGGTGLGLAIVKHIMLRHRGELDIRSRAGKGSTFTVSIPLYNS